MKNAPAFPQSVSINATGDSVCSWELEGGLGLTIRQYYAGLICANMWSNPESIKAMLMAAGPGIESIASAATQQADALITELEKDTSSLCPCCGYWPCKIKQKESVAYLSKEQS